MLKVRVIKTIIYDASAHMPSLAVYRSPLGVADGHIEPQFERAEARCVMKHGGVRRVHQKQCIRTPLQGEGKLLILKRRIGNALPPTGFVKHRCSPEAVRTRRIDRRSGLGKEDLGTSGDIDVRLEVHQDVADRKSVV